MAEKSTEKAPGAFSLLGTASTMGLHMVSGPIVGGGLGWLIDHWLDSWPIGASIGLLLGLAAGFRNVWADARYLERSNAVIDAEKKKQEEAAQKPQKEAEKSRSEAKKPSIVDIVPALHKADSAVSSGAGEPIPEEKNVRTEEVFTASVFAGTASSEERELEEIDETVEAIRRVLEGHGEARDAAEKKSERAGKGQI